PTAVEVVARPDGSDDLAYVACATGDAISMFSIPESGDPLTPLVPPTVAAPAGSAPRDLVATPDGAFLYVALRNEPSILQYAIQPDGTLAPLSPPSLPLEEFASSIEVTSDGAAVAVTIPALQELAILGIEDDGTLVPAIVTRTRSFPDAIALPAVQQPIQARSDSAYVALAEEGSVAQFGVLVDPGASSATFEALAPPTIEAGTDTSALAVHPDQDYVVAVNALGDPVGNLLDFGRDPSSGALTSSGAPTGLFQIPVDVAIEASGRFAYVVESGLSALRPVVIDKDSSPMAFLDDVTIGLDSRAVEVDPRGRTVYSVSNLNARVDAYEIVRDSGALSLVTGSPFAVGGSPTDLAVHPSGRFLYTSNGTGSISMFAIDGTTGALTPLGSGSEPTPAQSEPASIAIRPDGDSLYVTYAGLDELARFDIDPETGLLSAAEVVETGPAPGRMAIDATGLLLTLVLEGEDELQHFFLASSTGEPDEIGRQPAGGAGPRDVTFSRRVD
ncbi:MAG: beta-propeller fold lactonase family protein, partial [Planctomycetota bacterium]